MITRNRIRTVLTLAAVAMATLHLSACRQTPPSPNMEVISMDPASPAVLEPGQRLYVKFRYDSGGAESIRTWVRSDGKSRGCKSHPCRSITDKKGVYEGWFFFDNNAEVKSVKLRMKDDKDKHGYIFETSIPVDYKWKASKSDGPRGYAVPGTSVKMLSSKPALPAVLKRGEEFMVKFQYEVGDAKSITIQTWPNKKDRCFPVGYKRNFKNPKDNVGVYEYSMLYDRPESMKGVQFRMTDDDTGRVLIQYFFPVDVKWRLREIVSGQSSNVVTSDQTKSCQFDSIDTKIAKEYAGQYEGVWIYTLKDAKEENGRNVILQGKRKEAGGLEFSFLYQDVYDGAVFDKCSVDQYRANVYFKLKDNRSVMYSLTREKQTLVGTIYSSWKDPRKVTLRKAVDSTESNLREISLLKQALTKAEAEAGNEKKQKDQLQERLKNLEALFVQSKARNDELSRDYSVLNKKYTVLEQKYISILSENKTNAENRGKENGKLNDRQSEIQKQ